MYPEASGQRAPRDKPASGKTICDQHINTTMKIARRALTLYIAGMLVLTGQVFLWRDPPTYLFAAIPFYFLPAALLLLGLLVGWLGHMIVQHSKWIRSFYLFGLNLGFTVLLAILAVVHFQAWQEDRRYGYDILGSAMLRRADEDGSRYVATGFEKLQRSFADPRQVHLLGYRSTFRIPNPQFVKDSIITIYYNYYFGNDSIAVRFSRLELRGKHFEIMAFNQLPATDTTLLRLNKNYYERRKIIVDSLILLMRSIK